MCVFIDVDLLLLDADPDTIARIREAAWHAQAATEIANMLVTWRREVREGDFTSRAFALAFERGAASRETVAEIDAETLIAALTDAGVDDELMEAWRGHRHRLDQLVGACGIASAADSLLAMYLAARGKL
jgi:hypothetical protein